jgi:hypothetical protein
MKTIPGKKQEVSQATDFHPSEVPLIVLQRRTPTYPKIMPRKRYKMIIPVRSIPLEAGERNPRAAKTTVTIVIPRIWIPSGTITHNSFEQHGSLKTSPTTSFQSKSSSFI